MKALRKVAPGVGHVELCEVPIPEIGPREVLMKVYAAGVCGSDLLIQEDRHFYRAPVTLGHEFSGVAYQVGPEVSRVKEGDKFVADIECGEGAWLGVTIDDVFQTLQTYLGSTYVNQFNKFNQSFQVRVQGEAFHRRQLQDIADLYVANRTGQMVPLGALVSVRRMLGSELITRYNLYPSASVVGNAAPGFSSGQALDAMQRVAGVSSVLVSVIQATVILFLVTLLMFSH